MRVEYSRQNPTAQTAEIFRHRPHAWMAGAVASAAYMASLSSEALMHKMGMLGSTWVTRLASRVPVAFVTGSIASGCARRLSMPHAFVNPAGNAIIQAWSASIVTTNVYDTALLTAVVLGLAVVAYEHRRGDILGQALASAAQLGATCVGAHRICGAALSDKLHPVVLATLASVTHRYFTRPALMWGAHWLGGPIASHGAAWLATAVQCLSPTLLVDGALAPVARTQGKVQAATWVGTTLGCVLLHNRPILGTLIGCMGGMAWARGRAPQASALSEVFAPVGSDSEREAASAIAHAQAGRMKAAYPALCRALEMTHLPPQTHRTLVLEKANIDFVYANIDAGVDTLQKYLSEHPTDASALALRSLLYDRGNQQSASSRDIQKAMVRASDDAWVDYALLFLNPWQDPDVYPSLHPDHCVMQAARVMLTHRGTPQDGAEKIDTFFISHNLADEAFALCWRGLHWDVAASAQVRGNARDLLKNKARDLYKAASEHDPAYQPARANLVFSSLTNENAVALRTQLTKLHEDAPYDWRTVNYLTKAISSAPNSLADLPGPEALPSTLFYAKNMAFAHKNTTGHDKAAIEAYLGAMELLDPVEAKYTRRIVLAPADAAALPPRAGNAAAAQGVRGPPEPDAPLSRWSKMWAAVFG